MNAVKSSLGLSSVYNLQDALNALRDFVSGEIDAAINKIQEVDHDVKKQLASYFQTGLYVEKMSYSANACKNMDIMFAPKGTVTTTSLASCFDGCTQMYYVEGLEHEDEGGELYPTSLKNTFNNCYCLEILNQENWHLERCASLERAFYNCRSLKNLDVSRWDVGALTTINNAFYGCTNIKALQVDNWDTKKLVDATSAFRGCANIESFDLSGWAVGALTKLEGIFYDCSSVKSINLKGWNPQGVTSLSSLFANCKSLEDLDISDFDFNRIKSTSSIMINCGNLSFEGDVFEFKGGTVSCTTFSNALYGTPFVEVRGLDLSSIADSTSALSVQANPLYRAIGAKTRKCIFGGSKSIKFNCDFTQAPWNKLDAESVESFIKNCLYDWEVEPDGSHSMQVTSEMFDTLWTDEIESELSYGEYLIGTGWELTAK